MNSNLHDARDQGHSVGGDEGCDSVVVVVGQVAEHVARAIDEHQARLARRVSRL